MPIPYHSSNTRSVVLSSVVVSDVSEVSAVSVVSDVSDVSAVSDVSVDEASSDVSSSVAVESLVSPSKAELNGSSFPLYVIVSSLL